MTNLILLVELQFSKQFSVYIGDTFKCIHKIYVVPVLMVSMLTSSNIIRTRHVQFSEFVTVTPPFIQHDREIFSRFNLSRVYCLMDQEPCIASIKLKNNVSVCLSLCIFDGLVYYLPINLARCLHCCDFCPSFAE